MTEANPEPSSDELEGLRAENARLRERLAARSSADAATHSARASSDVLARAYSELLFLIGPDDTIEDYRAGTGVQLFVPPEAFMGRTMDSVLPPAAGAACIDAAARARSSGAPILFQYTLPMPEGELAYLARCEPLEGGQVVMLISDVSEREATATALREQTELMEKVLDHIPAMIAVFDPLGHLRYVNREWERTQGWTLAEVRAHADILGVFYPDPERRREVWERIQQASGEWTETEARSRDGRTHHELWANVRLSDGTLIGIGQDVTARKRLEEQFHEAQRLEGLGRLAGGVAHDFNNLLTAVLGYTELLEHRLSADTAALADLAQVRMAAIRARDLTHQLLAIARRQVISPCPVDPNALTLETLGLLARVLREDIAIESELEPAVWRVKVDPAQLQQVLMNLALNARDAMPTGGRLVLSTENVSLAGAKAESRGLAPGEYVRLSVRDTGVGMSRETLARLFEPFFTTKPRGEGTGLGLATVYGIVRQSGGHIEAESEPGEGARFAIWLPRVLEPMPEAVPERRPSVHGAGETVLAVEDDPAVRALTAQTLRAAGYVVLLAQDGREALELGARHTERIELLVTDVVMPHMSGRQLADAMLRLRPALRVLFVSGYAEDVVVHGGVPEDGSAFLDKPFTPTELLRKVREVLESPPPR